MRQKSPLNPGACRSSVAVFTVEEMSFGHTTREVVLSTDDWVEAERAADDEQWPKGRTRRIKGTHPTHIWVDSPKDGRRRCTECGGWDNGSYGSHAPCGYNWGDDSLLTALAREEGRRLALRVFDTVLPNACSHTTANTDIT